MLKPDKYFDNFLRFEFESKHWRKAKVRFRRAIREYFITQRRYVIDPESGERVQSVRYGQLIQKQKKQRRKVNLIFRGQKVGRPVNFEIKILMSRLFVLWGMYAKKKPTFTWKKSVIPTDFESMLYDLLPKLGEKNVRRYVENHWEEREKRIYFVK